VHSLSQIWTLARNTFRENLRDKILYNLLFFAVFLIGISIVLADLSIMEHRKIVTDIGLASINLVGVMIAIFVGIGLVSKEIERRTAYVILAKPISRARFILGKYLGLLLTLGVNVGIMWLVFLGTLQVYQAPVHLGLFQALLLMFVELALVTAVALFFSTFTSATLSAIFTLGLYVIGHLTADLRAIVAKTADQALMLGVNVLYYLCPNLELLNMKGPAGAGQTEPLAYVAYASAYGLVYATLVLAIACVVFERRNF